MMRFLIVSSFIINTVQTVLYLRARMILCPYLTHISCDLVKIRQGRYQHKCEVHENLGSESHSSLRLQTGFCFFSPHLFSDLALFRYETSEHNAVRRLKIL